MSMLRSTCPFPSRSTAMMKDILNWLSIWISWSPRKCLPCWCPMRNSWSYHRFYSSPRNTISFEMKVRSPFHWTRRAKNSPPSRFDLRRTITGIEQDSLSSSFPYGLPWRPSSSLRSFEIRDRLRHGGAHCSKNPWTSLVSLYFPLRSLSANCRYECLPLTCFLYRWLHDRWRRCVQVLFIGVYQFDSSPPDCQWIKSENEYGVQSNKRGTVEASSAWLSSMMSIVD